MNRGTLASAASQHGHMHARALACSPCAGRTLLHRPVLCRVAAEELQVTESTECGYKPSLLQAYDVRGAIGAGAFGKVAVAVHRQSGVHVAVKTLPKVRGAHSRASTIAKIQKEVQLHQRLSEVPRVAQLLDLYEDAESVHMVCELCPGGDLKQHVETHGTLDEHTLAQIAFEVLSTVKAFHARGILYADVKAANFCLMDQQAFLDRAPMPFHVKAVDFGCSQLIGNHRLSKRTGTLAYMAPEVFSKSYAHKVDVWSTGVMLHWLFAHRLPFWANDCPPKISKVEQMQEYVNNAPISFDYGVWLGMSPEGIDFISRCLLRPEDERLSVEEALEHPWLQMHVGEVQRAMAFLN